MKKTIQKTKLKVFLIHVFVSFIILLAVASYFLFFLYPAFLLDISSGFQALLILFVLYMFVGPILTLVGYDPNKTKINRVSSLAFIAVIQVTVMIYGFIAAYSINPRLIVIYENNHSVIVQQDTIDFNAKMGALLNQGNLKFNGVETILLSTRPSLRYIDPLSDLESLEKANQFARGTITNKADLNNINNREKTHQKVWVFLIAGRHGSAYVLFDENFDYLEKISVVKK